MNTSRLSKGSLVVLVSRDGSSGYGYNTESSDVDTVEIFAFSPDLYLLPEKFRGRYALANVKSGLIDIRAVELRDWITRLADGTPTEVILLYGETGATILRDPIIDPLFENRSLFITARCLAKFYHTAKAFDNKAHRSNVRNSKNAARAVYMAQRGIELATTGTTKMYQSEVSQLRDIRNGKIDLGEYEQIFGELDDRLYTLMDENPFPDRINQDKVDELTVSIMSDIMKG